MNRSSGLTSTLISLAVIGGVGVALAGVAHADAPIVGPAPSSLPYCGGQKAALHPVPYSCATKIKLIDGAQVWAEVHADGNRVTVVYHVAAPRPVDVPILITHHEGNSGAGAQLDTSSGVLPAGATTATLIDSSACRIGQLDIRYSTVPQPNNRVGGPTISNGTSCLDLTVVETTPTTGGEAPPVSSPPSTVTQGPPASSHEITVSRGLPPTGGTVNPLAAWLIIGMLTGGAALIVVSRRRGSVS